MAAPNEQRAKMLEAMARAKARMAESRAEAFARGSAAATSTGTPTPAGTEPSTPASLNAPAKTAPDFLTFADPTAARVAHRSAADASQSIQQRHSFIDSWASKIEEFVFDNTRTSMELPTELTGFDRKTLHQLATHYNLSHHSSAAAGGLRRLVLRKDQLFFAKAARRAKEAEINGIKAQNPLAGRRANRSAEEPVPEKEQYADRAAYKAFRKLKKATDVYSNAVDTGMTDEDVNALAALAHSARADAAGSGAGVAGGMTAGGSSAWDAALSGAQHGADAEFAAIAAAAAQGELFEVCTKCGTRAAVDYDPARWECTGPCDVCGDTTVFRLETSRGAALQHKAADERRKAVEAAAAAAADDDDDGAMAGRRPKRDRDDGDAAVAAAGGEDAARAEAATALSPDELVKLAELHDLPETDVAWVRAFAASRAKHDASTDHVLFCTDFADFAKYLPPAPQGAAYVFCRVAADEEGSGGVTKRINRVLAAVEKGAAPGAGGTATRDVFVCFPAFVPDDGMECVVAIALAVDRADEASAKLAVRDLPGPAVQCSDSLQTLLAGGG